MNVALTVKNTSKILKPTKDDVLIYDGKMWYVTTKEDLFKEWTKLLNEANEKIQQLEKQNLEFKKEVGLELQQMTNLIAQLFEHKGENL
ncbi:MAG: hypothetical protein K5765_06840 [Clostridia bacterium]|nr:hypothetical protein [Clostridia bacterium]